MKEIIKTIKRKIDIYNYKRHYNGVIKSLLGKCKDGEYPDATPADGIYLKATGHLLLADAHEPDVDGDKEDGSEEEGLSGYNYMQGNKFVGSGEHLEATTDEDKRNSLKMFEHYCGEIQKLEEGFAMRALDEELNNG